MPVVLDSDDVVECVVDELDMVIDVDDSERVVELEDAVDVAEVYVPFHVVVVLDVNV